MLENKKQSLNWQKTLNFISQCPICGKNYDSQTARLFLEKENTHLVHITCGQCGSYFLAMVIEFGKGISTIGMITDLSFEDVKRLHKVNSLTIDEVIEASEAIAKMPIAVF